MRLKDILGFIEAEILSQLQGEIEENISLTEAGARERRRSKAAERGTRGPKIKIGKDKQTGKKSATDTKRGKEWHNADKKGTVPTVRGRKLGKKGSAKYKKRETIGNQIFASIKSDPAAKKPFIAAARKHGVPEKEWPAFVWAAASDQAIKGGSGGSKKKKTAGAKKKGSSVPTSSTPSKKGKSKGGGKKITRTKDSKDKDQLNLGLN